MYAYVGIVYMYTQLYVCNTYMQFVVSQGPTLHYAWLLMERQIPDNGEAQLVLELEAGGPDPVA
jgi:hypothetical protein